MKVIEPPLIEPVSLAEVKSQIGIQANDTAADALISRRIKEARQWAEYYTGRAFIAQTREARWDRFVDDHELPSALQVLSVNYINENGSEITLSSDNYVLDTYAFIPCARKAFAAYWPATRYERSAVRIQYIAGYGSTPETVPLLIKEAIILLVGHWMNFQPNNENGSGISRIPYAVRDMLDIFRYEFL